MLSLMPRDGCPPYCCTFAFPVVFSTTLEVLIASMAFLLLLPRWGPNLAIVRGRPTLRTARQGTFLEGVVRAEPRHGTFLRGSSGLSPDKAPF